VAVLELGGAEVAEGGVAASAVLVSVSLVRSRDVDPVGVDGSGRWGL